MKHLKDFILEGRTIDEVKVKDTVTNKEVTPVLYAYDKDSLDKLIDKYKNTSEYWEDKGIYLTSNKNKSTWEVDTTEEYKFKVYQKDQDFFYSDNTSFTYDDLLGMINDEEKMIVVLNK